MPFSEKLSQLRKSKGLTQQEMAQKAGVGIAQLRRYEGGKSSPTLEVIKNIALTLGITTDELIFDDNEASLQARQLDRKLFEQFEMVSKLNPNDRNAIETIIESMILKSRLEEIVPGTKNTPWQKEMRGVVSKFRQRASSYSDEEIDDIVDEAVASVRAEEGKRD